MSKSDYPALRMRVEKGRLVPAGQFDQERLDSYRPGAIVQCRFTEEKDRILVKKWFAIIGLVIKTCETPWKNKDEAHEAIKLALGIVNLSKTVSGQFMQYPKSLTELEDPEMTEALENMTALLSQMTGVDVETLKKETAHIREEPNTNSDDSPSPSQSSGSAEGEVSPVSSPSATILDAAKDMLTIAGLSYADAAERDEAIHAGLEHWWSITSGSETRLDDIAVAARAVATKSRTVEQARAFLADRLGVTIQELSV